MCMDDQAKQLNAHAKRVRLEDRVACWGARHVTQECNLIPWPGLGFMIFLRMFVRDTLTIDSTKCSARNDCTYMQHKQMAVESTIMPRAQVGARTVDGADHVLQLVACSFGIRHIPVVFLICTSKRLAIPL